MIKLKRLINIVMFMNRLISRGTEDEFTLKQFTGEEAKAQALKSHANACVGVNEEALKKF